jgi:malate dehydrogenase (quinone)
MEQKPFPTEPVDVVLIGAGIMSATLGALLESLEPGWRVAVFERLEEIAAESSQAWNNAGTGHAAYCELNYTAEREDGSIDISKALKINEQFEVSKQFWAFLVGQGVLPDPGVFINAVPHMSFVRGAENVDFLRRRHAALTQSHLFRAMEFSDEPDRLRAWIPLMMEQRATDEPLAATRMEAGTDVNFGTLSRALLHHLDGQPATDIYLNCDVEDLERDTVSGHWRIGVRDRASRQKRAVFARFVFIGAGGGALELLNAAKISEADGYGGFPVSGQWLRCTNPGVIGRHHAKVYGKAAVGTPPMSMPHLDTRVIDGKKQLLFGPFAGLTTKFLKEGSRLDLLRSIDRDNVVPMIEAGLDNLPLTGYLMRQALQSEEDRLEALRQFYPDARAEDWELEIAGQRVQVIKDDDLRGGVLEFGTEIINSGDGTLAALLGASPGASTAVSIMLDLLARCFPGHMAVWKGRLAEMIPSYGQSLVRDEALWQEVTRRVNTVLRLGMAG